MGSVKINNAIVSVTQVQFVIGQYMLYNDDNGYTPTTFGNPELMIYIPINPQGRQYWSCTGRTDANGSECELWSDMCSNNREAFFPVTPVAGDVINVYVGDMGKIDSYTRIGETYRVLFTSGREALYGYLPVDGIATDERKIVSPGIPIPKIIVASNDRCPICYKQIQRKFDIRALPKNHMVLACGHALHMNCALELLNMTFQGIKCAICEQHSQIRSPCMI